MSNHRQRQDQPSWLGKTHQNRSQNSFPMMKRIERGHFAALVLGTGASPGCSLTAAPQVAPSAESAKGTGEPDKAIVVGGSVVSTTDFSLSSSSRSSRSPMHRGRRRLTLSVKSTQGQSLVLSADSDSHRHHSNLILLATLKGRIPAFYCGYRAVSRLCSSELLYASCEW